MLKSFTAFVIGASAVSLLSGCAATSGANYRPIVDTQGVDFNRYESDLRACQGYATQTASAGSPLLAGLSRGLCSVGYWLLLLEKATAEPTLLRLVRLQVLLVREHKGKLVCETSSVAA